MDVFNFEKTLLTRLNESVDVLRVSSDPISASNVRREWSYFVEIQIEPSGWQALWRIPRVICEELHISFPTVVFGTVNCVMFKELKAEFSVIAVQDDDVHIPEVNEVALEDLWPVKEQENEALNIETTANCIDMLRFFYKNIWMPWDNDNDDDSDWSDKYLESRLRFFYDLQKGVISRSLGHHIRMLLTEARYIQQRRDYLEHGIDDNEDELNKSLQPNEIADLMHLHWRMATIRNEIEILENPEMRKICEANQLEALTNSSSGDAETTGNTFMVSTASAIAEHLQNFKSLSALVNDTNRKVQICASLMDCLNISSASSEIFIPIGCHFVNFLEHLNHNGTIRGLPAVVSKESRLMRKVDDHSNAAVLMTKDDDSVLLVIDGDFRIENVTLDCNNVRTGILIRKGNVLLRDCTLIGYSSSSTKIGIDVADGATLTLINCVLRDFATAISCNAAASIITSNCIINGSGTAIECSGFDFKLTLNDTVISDTKRYGILVTSYSNEEANPTKKTTYDSIETASEKLQISGRVEFANIAIANIAIEQKPTAAPFRLIEGAANMFDLSEPIVSVPRRESGKFAVPLDPPAIHKKIKMYSSSSDDDMQETVIERSFDDIVVSDSDLSTSVIVID